MKAALRTIAMAAAAALAAAAYAQTAAKPLFASSEPLRLTITGPVSQIARTAARSRQPRPAVLAIAGAGPESHPIQLSPRGITRLKPDVCQFPPLRVRFQGAPAPPSVFSGQTQLKLVTHCRAAPAFQQYVLLEYAAYRLYNHLTPASFRARLATIDYVNDGNRPLSSRVGFFIEEIEDVAARNGMTRAVTGDRVARTQISTPDVVRVAMFQYMIGNLDWSIRAGPEGEGCCHNSRLITRAPGGPFVPVPYDFDYSGLVNAPYAVTPDGGEGVRARRFQGYCAHNAETLATAAAFRAQRGALMAVLNEVPLDESSRRRAASYLEEFFADIADDRSVTAKLLKTCIK